MSPKISLNPVTITPCNYEKSLQIASKAGFSGVGLRFNLIRDYLNSGHTLAEVKSLLNASKLQATEMGFLSGWMFHGGIPLAGKRGRTGESDKQLIEEMEFLFLVTKELGSPPITALAELNETGPIQSAIKDFADGGGGRDLFEAVEEELAKSLGSEVRFFAQREEAAFEALFDLIVGMMGASGAVEEAGAISLGLGKAMVPFIEGFSRDT